MRSVKEIRDSAFTCIEQEQRDTGEIPTYETYPTLPDKAHLGWHITFPSPFVHACVMYSLLKVKDQRSRSLLEKAKMFLLSTKDEFGLWRFYVTDDVKNPVVFDADDTSLASFVLRRLGIEVDNSKVFMKNLNDQGLPYTWFWPSRAIFMHSPKLFFKLKRQVGSAGQVLKAGLFHRNDVEPCVVANVLLNYPKEKGSDVTGMANWLIAEWRSETPVFQFYFQRIVLSYHISRAFDNGVDALGRLKDETVAWLDQELEGLEFPELLLAGLTMKNFGDERGRGKCLRSIHDKMEDNGFSWQPYPYFTSKDRLYFAGSRALTASWYLELSEGL